MRDEENLLILQIESPKAVENVERLLDVEGIETTKMARDLGVNAVFVLIPYFLIPQPMVIINKPGAGGVMGAEFVIRSKPDGLHDLFRAGIGP